METNCLNCGIQLNQMEYDVSLIDDLSLCDKCYDIYLTIDADYYTGHCD